MTNHPAIVPNHLLPLRADGRTHHPITDHVEQIHMLCKNLSTAGPLTAAQQQLLSTLDLACDAIIDELDLLAAYNQFGIR